MSYYIHHVPGRLRIKTARLRRAECRAKLGKMLEELPGISSHSHNDKIGNVLKRVDSLRHRPVERRRCGVGHAPRRGFGSRYRR